MKKISILIGYLFAAGSLMAQFNAGLKVNPGFGTIRSGALNGQLQEQVSNDQKIVHYSATSGAGFNFGLGAFGQYNVTPKVAIIAEPTFNVLYSRIYLNYKREDLDKDGSGSQLRIASTAKFRLFYFNLPVIVRYMVFERKKLYVIGGFSANLNTKPHLKSEEMRVDANYKYNNLTSSKVSNSNTSATMNKYSMAQFNFVLGVGKNFRRTLKNLSIDLRYSLPLTKSVMSNNSNPDLAMTYNNYVFSSYSSSVTMQADEGVKTPYYKMGIVNIAVKYTFYKK